MTRETVAMAQEYGANVEAEIGIVTGHEGKEFVGGAYTDPELAAKYVKETGIDALAASVGTVHGFYAAQPKLDFDRIVKIRELTGVPLVMHGGSGISVESHPLRNPENQLLLLHVQRRRKRRAEASGGEKREVFP